MKYYFFYPDFNSRRNLLKTPCRRAIIFIGCHQDGGRLALSGGTVTLRLHRNPKGNPVERRATLMLTIEGLIAVLSFGLTCFSIGYAIGRNDNHKTQK